MHGMGLAVEMLLRGDLAETGTDRRSRNCPPALNHRQRSQRVGEALNAAQAASGRPRQTAPPCSQGLFLGVRDPYAQFDALRGRGYFQAFNVAPSADNPFGQAEAD